MRAALRAALLLLSLLPVSQAGGQEPGVAILAQRVDTVYGDTLYVTQILYSPLSGNDLATTSCMGGRIISVVSLAVVGTDLFEEVVEHERTHIRQLGEMVKANGGQCPVSLGAVRMLAMEIEAYCGSRKIRMRKNPFFTKAAVDDDYIDRLQENFRRYFTLAVIAEQFRQGCP